MTYRFTKISFFLAITLFATTKPDSKVEIIPLQNLMQQNQNIQYQKCFDEFRFEFQPFPLSINQANHPNQGSFKETFIVTIPNGTVQSYGLVLADNKYISELVWKGWTHNLAHLRNFNDNQIIPVTGKVAVIGQAAANNYWHWLTEILCRLALLELQGIEYDYLYVECNLPFKKETLQLWGLNPNKIMVAQNNLCIKPDQLIVPSMVSNVNFPAALFSCYAQPHLLEYVKTKLLTAALKQGPSKKLHERIFISRKDAAQRRILNEDEVFELFQEKGFTRYELEKLSVVDQILLFHHAEIIVSPQGTGLANTIFCTEQTKIIELFQGLNDCTFWYLSQTLNLNYTPVQTVTFLSNYYAAWSTNTYMPLAIIKDVIKNLNL
jgi:hypothetical protein